MFKFVAVIDDCSSGTAYTAEPVVLDLPVDSGIIVDVEVRLEVVLAFKNCNLVLTAEGDGMGTNLGGGTSVGVSGVMPSESSKFSESLKIFKAWEPVTKFALAYAFANEDAIPKCLNNAFVCLK